MENVNYLSENTDIKDEEDYYIHEMECYGETYPLRIKAGETVKYCNKCYGRGHRGLVTHPQHELKYPKICKCVGKILYIDEEGNQKADAEEIAKAMEQVV